MWFKGKSKSAPSRRRPRRRTVEQRPSVLQVKMRRGGAGAWHWHRTLAITVALLAVAAGGTVIWLTLRMIGGALFWDNPLFVVRAIRVECPAMEVSRADIAAFLPFREGDNIFRANLADVRREMLVKLPRLKDIEISRRLPDTLQVRARERMALARLKMDGYALAVDAEGCVLGVADQSRRLPWITGHGLAVIRPGAELAGTSVMPALDVLSVCAGTPAGQYVRVARVDVRAPDELDLLLEEGEQVRLAWRQMQSRSTLAREHLEGKLEKLAEIKRQGRSFSSLDMTLDNNFPAR